jgi:peptidoglycan/xylan/chitin deacetylase (PgdA/CDA1 family)
VSPHFRNEIKVILDYFANVPMSLLITPFWDGKIELDKAFIDLVKNSEKILHGLTHNNEKNDLIGKLVALSWRSDRELYGLSEIETIDLIQKGKYLFERAFGEKAIGFVPPTWLHNEFSIDILRDLDFSFTETPWRLIDLKSNNNTDFLIKTPAICYDYGNNKGAAWFSKQLWKQFFSIFSPDLIRISIHPSDVKNGYLPTIKTLINTLHEKEYSFLSYQEYFKFNRKYDFNYNLHTQ